MNKGLQIVPTWNTAEDSGIEHRGDVACTSGYVVPNAILAERYRLMRRLGRGGLGSVWLAFDESLERVCAIKLIEVPVVDPDEAEVSFSREAKTTASVRSPHVVDVYDHGVSAQGPFIVMELLEGEDLAMRLQRVGRLDARTTYEIIAQIARGLASAHARGVLHRDLKPANIFLARVEEQEVAKVIDFGVATRAARFDASNPTDSTLMGTPLYMSPEQLQHAHVDTRSDLWSLAVLAYECLAGRTPFEAMTFLEIAPRILHEPVPSLSDFVPGVPEELDAWFARALARDPAERFQSAKEFANAFGRAAHAELCDWVPSAPPPRSLCGPESLQPASSVRLTKEGGGPRSLGSLKAQRGKPWSLAVVVLAALTIAGIVTRTSDSSAGSPAPQALRCAPALGVQSPGIGLASDPESRSQ